MSKLAHHARLREHPLIHNLLVIVDKLGLDLGDMVIFGSGPLLAKGLRPKIWDLDIVARNETWRLAEQHGVPSIGEVNGARISQFCDGRIQFSAGWVSDEWNATELIDRAEIIQGLPFAQLADVLAYKEQLGRPKDQRDIRRLRKVGVVPTTAAAGHQARSGVSRCRPEDWGRGSRNLRDSSQLLTVASSFPLLTLVPVGVNYQPDDSSRRCPSSGVSGSRVA
ncbi:hypothetical protein KGA66_17065 [Actinocrinis puniceicyclus]|uniref:Nucleotidyltransferase family protein n=1 Tax=Actinocrinis puniceicyclus TaxID=977794 RepID=A0A8J7WRP4_9ACTN|nr:hypothetical protein [Actinocrinis puniceicyclus]MBS2964772.1 hypothetical protein [Actinocrinis puniceicyclus]